MKLFEKQFEKLMEKLGWCRASTCEALSTALGNSLEIIEKHQKENK